MMNQDKMLWNEGRLEFFKVIEIYKLKLIEEGRMDEHSLLCNSIKPDNEWQRKKLSEYILKEITHERKEK